MNKISREFQVFVKPAGAECNLRCSYCYYFLNKESCTDMHLSRMPDELLERYILQLAEASAGRPVFFSWHGGEPLLAGREFYERAVSLQKKLISPEHIIINGIQTNGTLLNEEWCRFLARERFLVGISLDGPEELHDTFRKNSSGRGSFREVMTGFQLLLKYGIHPEILCVVHAENVKFPLDVYRFFKSLGVENMTFLPLVEKVPGTEHRVTGRSVPAENFGRFLISIFEEWARDDVENIKIQIFEETIQTAFLPEHTLCILKKECGGVPVVEANGDFYSCDHYVDPAHLPGNINDHSLSWYLDHPAQKAFGEAKQKTLPEYCLRCEVLEMCNGECPKNRFILTPEGEPGLNYLCGGYKLFFNHCRPFVEAVMLVSGLS